LENSQTGVRPDKVICGDCGIPTRRRNRWHLHEYGTNMKAIVHIGDFKTGSTSIQTLLMYNQGNLARQRALYRNPASNIGSNFEYLIAANIESETDIDFSNAVPLGLPNRNAQERMYETLKNQLQDDSTSPDFCKYLVSAEQIASQLHTSNQKEALHNFLLQFFDDVVYLIYIRCQEDILASEYSEHVRQSGTATLTDFVNHAMHWHNYDEMLTRWENTVGPERITVRLFDPGFLEDGDIISDYCKVVGLDLAKLDRPERENRALTAEAAELIRIMNETHPKFRPDRSMDHLAATLRRRLSRPDVQGSCIRLSREQRARVRAHHRKGNEEVRARWFPDSTELFPEGSDLIESKPIAEVREGALRLAAQLLEDPRALSRPLHRAIIDTLPPRLRSGLRSVPHALALKRLVKHLD
jgi:hypothetical protein